MTRKEREKHLDWLCRLKSEIFVFMPQHWMIPFADALDVAIRELAKEPCEDCISRKDVMDITICDGILCEKCSFNLMYGEPGCLLRKRLKELPSVQLMREGEEV